MEDVLLHFHHLPFRAYHTSTDFYAGSPCADIEHMNGDYIETSADMVMPGVEAGVVCKVRARRWISQDGCASRLELWSAEGPLRDWPTLKCSPRINDHLLWYRVYQIKEWGFASFLLRHCVPESRQFRLVTANCATCVHSSSCRD